MKVVNLFFYDFMLMIFYIPVNLFILNMCFYKERLKKRKIADTTMIKTGSFS